MVTGGPSKNKYACINRLVGRSRARQYQISRLLMCSSSFVYYSRVDIHTVLKSRQIPLPGKILGYHPVDRLWNMVPRSCPPTQESSRLQPVLPKTCISERPQSDTYLNMSRLVPNHRCLWRSCKELENYGCHLGATSDLAHKTKKGVGQVWTLKA